MMEPAAWSLAMDTALSRAGVLPDLAVAADVLRLLDATPDHGLTREWYALADAGRAWLGRLARVEVPCFNDIRAIEAALASTRRAESAAATAQAEPSLAPASARPAWQNRADCGDGE